MTKTGVVDIDIFPYDRLADQLDGYLSLRREAAVTEDDVLDVLGDASVLITTSRFPVTERVVRESNLELVAKFGTGIDNIDLEAAERGGVTVTYTPGMNALSVAEHTLTLTLATLRHVPTRQALLREGKWRDESPMGTMLSGSTVGIIGFGNVGSRFAGLLSGFDVDVLAYDPYVPDEDAEITGADLVELDRLLAESDVVTVNAELTNETHHLVGADELAALDDDAILVNTARGPIVDEDALVAALRNGGLAGAGLDVFEEEPLPASSPLHDFDTVVTTPHCSAMTQRTRERVIDKLGENVRAFYDGERIPDRYLAVVP